MKLLKSLSLLLLASLIGTSCKKDETSCPNSKTEFTVGNGKIYVPNIFTNNGDGINDAFFIFSDTSILSIKDLKIKNGKGKTIFEKENVQLPNTLFWNIDSYKGRFSYSFEAKSSDGTTANVSGHALSFTGGEKLDCDGCRFGTQHNGIGEFDEFLPSLEFNTCK